jgi:hypothetical protein
MSSMPLGLKRKFSLKYWRFKIMANETLKATGNLEIRGKWISPEGNPVEILDGLKCIEFRIHNQIFAGTATDGGVLFGGTPKAFPSPEDEENFGNKLATYQGGNKKWAKVVHVPAGKKFKAEFIQGSTLTSFAIIHVTIFD